MQEQFESIQVISFNKKKSKKSACERMKLEAPSQTSIKIVDQQERYIELLKRVTQLLQKNNPALSERSKIVLKPPQCIRVGVKTVITNFTEICKQINRHPEHVMNFFINEFGRQASMGNQGLVIRNLIKKQQIYNLFKKYIVQYVQCLVCKRFNTQLVKDVKMRIWRLQCRDCLSKRTVPTIQGSEKKIEDFSNKFSQRQINKVE